MIAKKGDGGDEVRMRSYLYDGLADHPQRLSLAQVVPRPRGGRHVGFSRV